MSELSPGTRALLRAARAAREVPDGAADRVRDAVEQSAALIASGAHPLPPPPPSPAWGLFAAPKLAGLAAVTLALGTAALRAHPPAPARAPAVAPVVRPVAAPALPAPIAPLVTAPVPTAHPSLPPGSAPRLARTRPLVRTEPAASIAPMAPPVAPAPVAVAPLVAPAASAEVPAAAPVDAPTLADEVHALGAARASLRAGSPAEALASLDTYARRHPAGALRDESDALRVRALCDAGRRDEARAVATSLLTRAPHSPLAPTVRRSCAFDGS